jgi:hypothetical protein
MAKTAYPIVTEMIDSRKPAATQRVAERCDVRHRSYGFRLPAPQGIISANTDLLLTLMADGHASHSRPVHPTL